MLSLTAAILALFTLAIATLLFLSLKLVRQEKTRQAYMYEKIFSQLYSPERDKTTISYYEVLKSARALLKCDRLLQLIGSYTEREYKIIYPLLLHLEAYIYNGDLKCEEQQNKGNLYTETLWRKNVENLLNRYQIYDLEIQNELDNLEKYFIQESEIMLGEVEINEQNFLNITYMRSSDIYFLLRVGYKLKGIPYNEDFFNILKPMMVIEEIRDDLESYEKDVAENSFNSLRIYVQLYGKEQAAQELRKLRKQMIYCSINNLAKANKRAVVEFWKAFLGIELGIPFILLKPLNLVPRALHIHLAKLLPASDDKYYGVIPKTIDEPQKTLEATCLIQ
ncbi:hypothetical protein NSTC745_05835 [Nostoc sp. DSM 114161]|jgi:hypothetical protein|uniref:hypothetical protein n=1 Tax=Nostoc sp. DSM 114161 TaxID=3440143 RepID=UPI004045706A